MSDLRAGCRDTHYLQHAARVLSQAPGCTQSANVDSSIALAARRMAACDWNCDAIVSRACMKAMSLSQRSRAFIIVG